MLKNALNLFYIWFVMNSFLIYGDYSSYGRSLSTGFRALGYKSDVFDLFGGDGYKEIKSDFSVPAKVHHLLKFLYVLRYLPKILSYDVIFIMNPVFVRFIYAGPLVLLLSKLLKKRIILLCCGDDVYYIRGGQKGILKKWVYSGTNLPKKNYFKSPIDIVENQIVSYFSDLIVPTMYDYAQAWRASPVNKSKLAKTIPLACDTTPVQLKNIERNSTTKIKILHGITRSNVKGSDLILRALEKIKEKYADEVEIIVVERVTYAEYLRVLEYSDVLIDQAKGHSYGINCILGLLSGKVVLSCADRHCLEEFGLYESPIQSITHSEIDIFEKLEHLIQNKNLIPALQVKGVNFAVDLHSPSHVAGEFMRLLRSEC